MTAITAGQYVAEHADLIAKIARPATHPDYEGKSANAIAGVRAGLVRRCRIVELELSVLGADYDAYVPPRQTAKRAPGLSDADLLQRVADLKRVIANDSIAKAVRSTGERVLAKCVEDAKARGLSTEPVAPVAPVKPKRTRKTANAAA